MTATSSAAYTHIGKRQQDKSRTGVAVRATEGGSTSFNRLSTADRWTSRRRSRAFSPLE